MTAKEYREKVNPCFGCDCYDEDLGCSMPSLDRQYACSLEEDSFLEVFLDDFVYEQNLL